MELQTETGLGNSQNTFLHCGDGYDLMVIKNLTACMLLTGTVHALENDKYLTVQACQSYVCLSCQLSVLYAVLDRDSCRPSYTKPYICPQPQDHSYVVYTHVRTHELHIHKGCTHKLAVVLHQQHTESQHVSA